MCVPGEYGKQSRMIKKVGKKSKINNKEIQKAEYKEQSNKIIKQYF